MKRRILSLLVLLMVAVTGVWAERVIVTFSANGKSIVKENVTLPYTYWCHYSWEDGELDQIIRDLYDNIESGYCWYDPAPTSSGDHITAGMGDSSDPDATEYLHDVYIALGEGFRGSATVTCTYTREFSYYEEVMGEWMEDTEQVSVSLTITATPVIDVTGVSLPATATLAVAGTTTLTATVAPDNATNKTVTWTTSDASVATVDANGVVTAMGTGTATITATTTNGTADTSDDQSATCTVTVTAAAVTGVTLPASAAMTVGQSVTLTPTIVPSYATDKTVTWTTNDASVATVVDGVVTAVGAGTATITVTTNDGGFTAACTVTTTYNGQFTINAGGDKVIFAQGNLQAVCASADADSNTPETFVWRFAEHQWDYIGGNYQGGSVTPTGNNFIDGNGSVSAAGTVDLFSWVGESSTLTGAAAYGLTNTWGNGSESGNGNNANEGLKADWGNLFGAGWHTPSKDEWNYLCNTRSTASGVRYAKAVVNSVPGVILLPDDWSTSYYALKSTNDATVGFATNTITATNWTNSLEAHGAVFLPIAGLRSFGNIWNVGGQGFYWSSTPYEADVNCAYIMTFHATTVEPQWTGNDIYRGYGMSVRLVKDMPIDVTGITLSQTEADITVGGETLTLTATVAPSNATDKTVTWTTSDASICTVADGVVTAVGAGTATITATATNGTVDTSDDFSATCTVNVTVPAITLADDTDNSTTLAKWDGYEADVTLTRTLQTGSYNTFAVPFAISSTDLTTLGITAKQLVSSTFADGVLTLNFADASSIEAGKPYLVKVAAALNLGSIVFDAVEVSSTAVNTVTGAVDFIPTFGKQLVSGPVGSESDTKAVLFLGANNTLYHPTVVNDTENESSYIKGFRAYFRLKDEAATARAFRIDFGDGDVTGISTISADSKATTSDATYTLDGRRISQPAQKGVYIQNGKKVIIK